VALVGIIGKIVITNQQSKNALLVRKTDSYIELGVVLWEKYSYIKLRDKLPHQSNSEYPDTGADIDAIGAISSSSPITTTCFDSDEDGVIDDWDKCPNTINGSWINSIGCPAQGLYIQKNK